ncbi:MAG: molybdopterin-dependent oxidoreductase, partial [Clostridiales Family XIII bacterium]|nr:molybdopterin-dependent oxidoreductase [Clostridiales Family XIII bacterium]
DHGAYNDSAGVLIAGYARYTGFPYSIPNVRGLVRVANTNHNFGTAYRGFGSPQSYTCSESMIDMLAEKMGMDPFEFRALNVARPGDLTINNRPYRECNMVKLMDMMRPYWEEAKARLSGKETDETYFGVGISCGGFNVTIGPNDRAEIALELNPDGTVTHFNTWEDPGQGGDIGSLVHAHKALAPLGLRPDQIRLMMNDTHLCPNTGIAAASRSHFMAGYATIDAADKLMDAMRKPDGTFRTYDEMAAEHIPVKYVGVYDTTGTCEDLDPNTGEGDPVQSVTYGIFLAEVEVEKKTGKVSVTREVAVGDIGVIGSVQAVEGQAYGGISHTIGYALKENYDDLHKHRNIAGAGIPYIEDVPDDIRLIFHEHKREIGPHGSTGCSELFQSGGHVAVLNAIHDAIGQRIYTLPASPEKVKAAIDATLRGETIEQARYFLGNDMYEVLDEIERNPV